MYRYTKFISALFTFVSVFDSSSKVPSGILNGNLAEYGAYTQCLNIYENTEYGPIRGRHCSFRITPTEKLLRIVLSFRNVSTKVYTFFCKLSSRSYKEK